MNPDQVINLTRQTLEITIRIVGPLLAVAIVVGIVISIVQVVTSIQDVTISTVPRLAAVGATAFFLSPWMFRQMVQFTARILSDFHPYLH